MKFKIKSKSFDFVFLGIVSLFFFFLIIFDVNSWYYSAIGDEYAFFNFAKSIVLGESKLSFFRQSGFISILDQKGVYDFVSVATSVYQAFIMKLFGVDHRGWIISSILIVILAFVFFYFFIKELLGKKVAVFSLFFFAFSHYLWAFTHIGYWNIHAFFPLFLSLYMFMLGLKQKNFFLFASGIFSGLCFYTNYFSRISLFLIFLYLVLSQDWIKKVRQGFIFLAGFLATSVPYFWVNQKVLLEPILKRSLLASGEIPREAVMNAFWKNTWASFFAFFQNDRVSHFVSGSLLDPLFGLFVVIGLIVSIFAWKKYRFILFTLICLLFMVGGLSQYPYVAISRLYFLLPVLALVGGIGLGYVSDKLCSYFSSKASWLVVCLVMISVLTLNLYRFYWETPQKMDLTQEALIIKAFSSCPADQQVVILYQTPEPLLKPALESYGLSKRSVFIKNDKQLSEIIEGSTCFIIAHPENDYYLDSILQIKKNQEVRNYYSSSGNKKVTVVFLPTVKE